MRNLSSKWKEKVNSGMDVQYLKYADITLTDGTTLNLTSSDLWENGMSFEDSVSGDNGFDIGSAIINVLNLTINNFDGQYSDYDFDGATVVCYIGLSFDDGTTEKIRICTVTVVEQPEDETVTIDLTCEDNMRKFDRNYSESKLTYPATRGQIVRDACDVCGVTLLTTSFDNDDYIVQVRPDDDALTFRQLLQWVAQIGCQWMRCDEYGRLCVQWFDVNKTSPQEIRTTYGFTPQHTDVVITGIKVTEYSDSSEDKVGSYISGTEGYVLGISDNKLIRKGDGQTVASMIAEKCVGMQFRPFESQCPTNIALEAGDAISIVDRNGKTYNTYLTTTTLSPGSGQNISCNAKSAAKNSSTRYSQVTQAYVEARKMVEKEKTARELAIKNLQESLSVGSGLFATYVKQEDGSTISYFHDKASLAESKNVIKITSEAIGVSNDGGKTYPFGFQLTGTLITKLLYAEGINANYIDTGALTIKDEKENVIFSVNMDTNTVYMNPDILIIGNQTLTEKLTAMDNSIAEAKNMTMQLTNDYQSITTDSDGNIPGTFPTVTTTAQVMYGNDNVTGDCTYNISKSSNVTGSWNSSTYTYTVTGLSADDGWVDIKATYLQTLSITRRFTIAKLRAGANGKTPVKGVDYFDGDPGTSSYLWIRYAKDANGTGMATIPTSDTKYIGTATTTTVTAPTSANDYKWSKYVGENGTPGANGYVHIAYANSADGRTGFSVSDGTNKLYIGQYTDTTKEDSTDPTKYTWSKIKGEQGADGKPGRTYIIEPSCNVLKRGADKNISPNFLEFNAYYRDGDSATRYAYKGRFVIEETADGNTWTTIYRSSTDESTVKHYLYTILTDGSGQTVTDGNGTTVGIPRDITNIRCKLYASGGTTTLMDMQSVAVAVDVASLTQEQIFNILTNGGEAKGIYKEGNQLYISFSYAKGGELVLGGVSNGYGFLKVVDMYDDEVTSVIADSSGITCTDSFSQKGNDFVEYAGVRFSKRGLQYVKAGVDITGDVHFEGDGYPYEPYDNIISNWINVNQDANGDYVCDGYFNFLRCESGLLYPNSITIEDTFSVSDKSGVKPEFKKEVLFRQGLRVYNYPTVTSGHNCYINQNTYQLSRYSSSSKRYKNIGNKLSEEFIYNLYNITPVMAQYKDGYLDKDDERVGEYFPMFIAEDVEKYFPLAVDHVDGLAENWNERIMVPAMFAMLKSQKSEIDTLKQELDEIKQLLRKE